MTLISCIICLVKVPVTPGDQYLKLQNSFRMGFITRTCQGDVSIWYEKWLERGCIAELIPFVNIQDTQKVKDICYDGVWHFNLLATQLPQELKVEMQSISTYESSVDVIIWNASNSGQYSARSGYLWLSQMNDNEPPLASDS